MQALVSELRSKLDAMEAALKRDKAGYAYVRAFDQALQTSMWKVRKAGLGLLLGMKGERKPIAFVEDCAVEPSRRRKSAPWAGAVAREERCPRERLATGARGNRGGQRERRGRDRRRSGGERRRSIGYRGDVRAARDAPAGRRPVAADRRPSAAARPTGAVATASRDDSRAIDRERESRASAGRVIGVSAVIGGEHVGVAVKNAEAADGILFDEFSDFVAFVGKAGPIIVQPYQGSQCSRSNSFGLST